MPDVKWTAEQESAINIRNSKTLVAAGAGSGKTAVLVERIIKKVIEDGTDIDKMLIVTFTNAAASEMKERIRDRLYNEVTNNSELKKQILLLNHASIMTIDAFCKKAVKDYFYKLDIDPNFKIADNAELELMKLEAIDETLEELYESKNEDIIDVLDSYSTNKSDEALINLILSIHRFIQSCPYPFEWLNEKCEMYNVSYNDFSETIWGKEIIHYTRDVVNEILEELIQIRDELENDEEAKNYLLTIQDDILTLSALRKNNLSWDDFYQEFKNIEFSGLKRAPKMDAEMREYVQEVRKKMKKIIAENLRDNIFISSSEEISNDLKRAYIHACTIKNIIELFDENFKIKKQNKNILDFSDIEHLCLKLFNENPDVLQDYINKYQEILIDEYQDSNLIQESILTKISNGNLFMVGDVKQSIYKFRQARPELFLEKYEKYNLFKKDSENVSTENKILLFKNFRSNKNIINQINFIFQSIMSKETGEIDYIEDEFLKFGATNYDYIGEKAELHLINKKESTTDENNDEVLLNVEEIDDKPQLEARVVANRIKELVGNFEVYDKTIRQKRKAKYSDIVILLRATKGCADIFAEELAKKDIPVFTDVKTGYFDNPEVQVILSLLKIVDNPYQDIPLISVLRSPIGNFDVNELTKIRLYDRKSSFIDAMMIAAKEDDKVKNFLKKLNTWREKSKYLTIDELLSYLYDDTKYYYYISLLPNGENRQNNLKVLLKKATDYEKSSYKGLYNFLNFIENVKLSSGDMDAPSLLSESDNVVRIMSIHKSKGLEFPIVFLSGAGKEFNNRDLQNRIILNQDLGFGFDIVEPKKRLVYESIPKLALKLQNKKESIAEEMRVLYVALTRAKEKLIVTGLVDNYEKKMDLWSAPVTKYSINSALSYIEWLGKAVISKSSDWDITSWTYNEALCGFKNDSKSTNLESEEKSDENNDDVIKPKDNSYIFNLIENRFNYRYPYKFSTKIPAKFSVSELKRLNNYEDFEESRRVREIVKPDFISEEEIKGATYGTLLHNKMEHLDFNSPDLDSLLSDIKDYKVKRRLSKDIESFLNNNLYNKIRSAKSINREVPFNLSVTVKDIFPSEDISAYDEVMVQGIIDLYFETDEGIIIVDYKSDYLTTEEEFINRYNKQLDYYKRALEQITGKKVINSYIYSFNLKREIKIN